MCESVHGNGTERPWNRYIKVEKFSLPAPAILGVFMKPLQVVHSLQELEAMTCDIWSTTDDEDDNDPHIGWGGHSLLTDGMDTHSILRQKIALVMPRTINLHHGLWGPVFRFLSQIRRKYLPFKNMKNRNEHAYS